MGKIFCIHTEGSKEKGLKINKNKLVSDWVFRMNIEGKVKLLFFFFMTHINYIRAGKS